MAREPLRPSIDEVGARQRILADLDQHMWQSAPFAMYRNRVVTLVIDIIGKIVADRQVRLAGKTVEQQAGQPAVAVIGKIDMPGPDLAGEIRGKAVNREQCRRLPALAAAVQQSSNGL